MAVLVVSTARLASAATDPRELKAREAFAAGRYQDALDVFAKLYAESLNPIYLRNIGRCHQNLGEPDRAIASFRDYLRKANVPAAERKEIDGYIKEMEELKRKKEASASSAPPTPQQATPAEPVTPLPREVPAPAPGSSSATASVVMTPSPPAPVEEPSPIYSRWWFWAIVGGVVVTGLGVAAAAGAFTKTEDATCPDLTRCQ